MINSTLKSLKKDFALVFSTLSICNTSCIFFYCLYATFSCFLVISLSLACPVSGYLLCQFQWIFQDVYKDGSRNNRVCERTEYNNDNWKMNLKTWKASNKRKDWVKYHFKIWRHFLWQEYANDIRSLIASILQIKLSFESFSMRFSSIFFF